MLDSAAGLIIPLPSLVEIRACVQKITGVIIPVRKMVALTAQALAGSEVPGRCPTIKHFAANRWDRQLGVQVPLLPDVRQVRLHPHEVLRINLLMMSMLTQQQQQQQQLVRCKPLPPPSPLPRQYLPRVTVAGEIIRYHRTLEMHVNVQRPTVVTMNVHQRGVLMHRGRSGSVDQRHRTLTRSSTARACQPLRVGVREIKFNGLGVVLSW